MEPLEVSLVIPVYNEEKRLEPRLSESLNFLETILDKTFEIIFVNDGSTDKTLAILNETKNKFTSISIKIMSYERNQGKGFAVKYGVLESRGAKIIVSDADFSIDLEETPGFIEKLNQVDIVIGTKKHSSTQTLKQQKIVRKILGKGFTLLTNCVLGLDFTDITCGFKGFRTDKAKILFSKLKTFRWSYDAEILFLARKNKFNVAEIPVKWQHVEGGTISPVFESLRSLRDLSIIILNYHLGRYR